MYIPDSYRAPNSEAAVEIIAANPWGVLVGCTDEAALASDISVILDREGEPGATLLGQLARANPYSRLLSRRPIFETEARDYWARIGHGAGVINFDSTRFAAHEIPPDKARREARR